MSWGCLKWFLWASLYSPHLKASEKVSFMVPKNQVIWIGPLSRFKAARRYLRGSKVVPIGIIVISWKVGNFFFVLVKCLIFRAHPKIYGLHHIRHMTKHMNIDVSSSSYEEGPGMTRVKTGAMTPFPSYPMIHNPRTFTFLSVIRNLNRRSSFLRLWEVSCLFK